MADTHDLYQHDLRDWTLVGDTFRLALDSTQSLRAGLREPKPMVHNGDCQWTRDLTSADVSDTGWTSPLPAVAESLWSGEDTAEMRADPDRRQVLFCIMCCCKRS